jgi:hypothetical protein
MNPGPVRNSLLLEILNMLEMIITAVIILVVVVQQ